MEFLALRLQNCSDWDLFSLMELTSIYLLTDFNKYLQVLTDFTDYIALKKNTHFLNPEALNANHSTFIRAVFTISL